MASFSADTSGPGQGGEVDSTNESRQDSSNSVIPTRQCITRLLLIEASVMLQVNGKGYKDLVT